MPDKFAITVKEPLWAEDGWVAPVLLIKMHRVQVSDDHGALGDSVATHHRILRRSAEDAQWDDIAKAQDFMQHCLHIRHPLLVFKSRRSAIQDAIDLHLDLFCMEKNITRLVQRH